MHDISICLVTRSASGFETRKRFLMMRLGSAGLITDFLTRLLIKNTILDQPSNTAILRTPPFLIGHGALDSGIRLTDQRHHCCLPGTRGFQRMFGLFQFSLCQLRLG